MKVIRFILPLIVLSALLFVGYHMVELSRQQKKKIEKITHLPLFELKDMQGKLFTNANLKKGAPVVFLYFNSECEFCQTEIENIVTNIQKFDGVQLVFVSIEPIQKIIMFQTTHKLDIYDNTIFLSDYRNIFSEIFDVNIFPSSLVYNKNGMLLSRNNGAVKANYLLKILKNNKIRNRSTD